ncbi:UNVERIFIED_CONTAM: hypothetical protein Sangu_1966400 [Sesamum angustifolium]|uniref:Uncharacterized protein n=1 Tax=Sesamum angustifolium TaxID=2727405 RepID=A0AAW2M0D9_9LAMI
MTGKGKECCQVWDSPAKGVFSGGSCVFQPKWHGYVIERSVRGNEADFLWSSGASIIWWYPCEASIMLRSSTSGRGVHQLIDPR